MPFQATIAGNLAAGVPGELGFDGPLRVRSCVLATTNAANNIVGATALTMTGEGVCVAGGTGVFGGILVGPKEYATYGPSLGSPLSPTMTVPNGIAVERAMMGTFYVTLTAAAAIGDLVVYDTTTGALSTVAAGSGSAGAGKAFVPNCVVTDYTVTGAGLALVRITN